ncbi:Proteasome subunit beta type-2 [Trichoplax sp. H2]|uniref:Proteasome subunit beta n=1 Tax=Trichoplax adhaerens TaxID=10228 RepID=B3S239_TRIAD|nr:hypothetical protein TRIADDRAFT_50465 [Trichoplax adhaerens]EDV23365.1 hypothetical protein TRIADDRAFT_50465 [Trichoplax adhaerens]RDD46208.1 Proteasome subunit beta type-2 [Trichoplax sp. H2]|eukprot:XP_002114275.1 hypothetical protein TRIADDRAFT_50465 [Trichoplax adhaerens]
MEFLIGLTGEDFVLVASDSTAGRSVVVMNEAYDKTFKLGDKVMMACSGDPGDSVQFAEFVAKNVELYRIKNGYSMTPNAAANYTRHQLAQSLRSSTPYTVNMLIGGYDEYDGPSLYYLDYLASLQKLPFGAHGYGSYFTFSILDRYYKKGMSKAEALKVLSLCLDEVKKRFIINLPSFNIKFIDKDGIHETSLQDIQAS